MIRENKSTRIADSYSLKDKFPDTTARRAVVTVVRGFGVVQRLMGPYFGQFGLTPPQFQLLTVANRLKDSALTQRSLARALYVSFPNITVMLKRLEEGGLIQREANLEDRREKFVRLTKKGSALLEKIWEVHQQQLEYVMCGLDDAERQDLTRLLGKMISSHESRDSATVKETSAIKS